MIALFAQDIPITSASPWWLAALVPILLTLGGGAKWAWDEIKDSWQKRKQREAERETAYVNHLESALERLRTQCDDFVKDCDKKETALTESRVKIERQAGYIRHLKSVIEAAGLRVGEWPDEPSGG